MMHHSSICIMDLPTLQNIPFLHCNAVLRGSGRPRLHRNGLAHTDSMLVYSHSGCIQHAALQP